MTTTSLEYAYKTPVRIIPELNIAALHNRRDRELKFWYLLRFVSYQDFNGCGRVPLAFAEKVFTEQFGYPRRTFYRHLSLGTGKLWETYNNRGCVIKIYAVTRACQYLSTFKLSRYVNIWILDFVRAKRKAILWNTGAYRPFGTGRRNNPISRQSLEDVTGISERNQQRYDHQANTCREETTVKSRDPITYKAYVQHIQVYGKGGQPIRIRRQLGNIYTSEATRSQRGILCKAARQAKERSGSFSSGEARTLSLMPAKRFYSAWKDYLKAHLYGKAIVEDSYYPRKGIYNNDPYLRNGITYIQCEVW